MGVTTLNNTYLLTEIKEGFSIIDVGGVYIKQREFEGTDYCSFSNRCKVAYTPFNSEIKEGAEVIVEHSVIDRVIEINGEELFVADPRDIFGVKVNDNYPLTHENYIKCFKPFKGFFAVPTHKKIGNGFKNATTAETESEEQYTVDLNGVELEYLEYADYEIFLNEKRYHFIRKDDCFLIGGVLNEDTYSVVTDDTILIGETAVQTSKSGVRITRNDNIRGYNNR